MKTLVLTLVVAGWLLTGSLAALHVKVVRVDHRNRTVVVLLPIHHVTAELQLASDEPELEVRAHEFYEAELQAGEVDTVKRNWLHIKVRPKKTVRFRLRKVTFQD